MPFTSEHHFISIDVHNDALSSFGDTPFVVQGMQGVEGISQLFRFKVDLVSNHVIPFDMVVGQRATLTMLLQSEDVRWFHGMISELSQGGTFRAIDGGQELIRYEATLVPRLWTLTRTVNSRVWEEKTVQEIIDDVLEKNTAADERSHDVDFEVKTLNGTHPPLTYTVQYYETDFDFLSRLLEEQGLAYYHFHDVDHEQLVIFDTSAELPELKAQYSGSNWEDRDPTTPAAIRGPVFGAFSYEGSGGSSREWQLDAWSVRQGMPPGLTTTRGYDFTQPANYPEMMTFGSIKMGPNEKLEVYEFQPEYTDEEGSRYGGYQQEAEEAASHQIEGRGCSASFEPGNFITVKGNYPKLFDTEKYLISRVHHMLTQSIGHQSGAGDSSYENAFSCLPDLIPFRSRQSTPKPSVHGTETAVVVGPEGEEIEVDKWGRIRIQFHWDREDRKTKGENVCWARVATQLAGSGWGTVYTPRIGQEVVVSFIQGNPDRPLVTGVVYNGTHKVPWELDANKTQSGIKTRSSMKGSKAHFNELRFEDKKGSEEILLHAEKDYTVSVENNRTVSIGGDESTTIDKSETRTIKGDKGQKVTVTTGDRDVKITAGSDKLKVGTDMIVHATSKINMTADGEMNNYTPLMRVFADDQFYVTTADSYIFGNTNQLEGDAGTVTINASSVTIAVGGSTVEVTDGAVTVTSSVIKLNS